MTDFFLESQQSLIRLRDEIVCLQIEIGGGGVAQSYSDESRLLPTRKKFKTHFLWMTKNSACLGWKKLNGLLKVCGKRLLRFIRWRYERRVQLVKFYFYFWSCHLLVSVLFLCWMPLFSRKICFCCSNSN